MITSKYIRDNAPDYVGTLRINHDNCPAGTDTRRRLYLTRKEHPNTLVLAHCFNCGQSGVADEVDKLVFARAAPPPKRVETTLPENCISLQDPECPPAASAWPLKFGVTWETCDEVGIKFDEESGRIIMPVWNVIRHTDEGHRTTTLCGYQSRRVYDTSGPKYLNVMFEGRVMETMIINERQNHPVFVIVEDLLSALKVSKWAACTVPLYGTHIRSERLLAMVKRDLPIVVWLDNDNPTVHHQRDKIVSLAKALGGRAFAIKDFDDPKRHDNTTINSVVVNACKELSQ